VGATPDLCVAHLVWEPAGIAALTQFADSYRRHPPGLEHRLLVIFNGFRPDDDLTLWRRAIGDLHYEELHTEAPVLDLVAYDEVAKSSPARTYCFLNSYSVIRADDWLAMMRSAADRSGVGAVGATGSWASQVSYLRLELALGGPYRRVFADRVATIRTLASLSPSQSQPSPAPDPLRGALSGWRALANFAMAYRSFPNPHLRTNCLLVDREVWLEVCSDVPSDKGRAYRFESGRRGLTARLKSMGLQALVVGRDGRAYESPQWPASRTFWQGDQENLLVEDNQTRAYRDGDAEVRRALSGFAWGQLAEPLGRRLPEAGEHART
jgi:hypothetical protein